MNGWLVHSKQDAKTVFSIIFEDAIESAYVATHLPFSELTDALFVIVLLSAHLNFPYVASFWHGQKKITSFHKHPLEFKCSLYCDIFALSSFHKHPLKIIALSLTIRYIR